MRPRKGQTWTDGIDAVTVLFRRSCPPTRPHGDNPASFVAFVRVDDGNCGGVTHESDFVDRFSPGDGKDER